ncbi:serine hydrolase domain-containing protein [Allonocardiopsis opalescens]|uniref:CubicO group peptidase (Beta-lactamase class C family) n=1 Tax=Allonocardiopsis opalescens TaxID=1144618 RepID=A0A2T0Q2B9_9ACTN|nr:serine hydrolase domain-containing protein [Allonocardiopsis opalescens]PRX97937.1 CubicO group peptidase (beta-lactamase class C family) [Allonocardiopsis opalescens]
MDSNAVGGIGRRRLLGWGGLAAAGVAAAGAQLVGAPPAAAAAERSGTDRIPPDARPGGAYDRYVAGLAAEDRFSGVVLLSYQGRTVLSRSYGMADRERGIRNHEDVAVNLSSASQPFLAVAVLRLMQEGELALSDTVGTHLTGFAADIAERVTVHHLLTSTSGLDAPMPDWERVFHSREEVREYHEQWTRQATLVVAPGSDDQGHTAGGGAGLAIAAQIVEAVTGTTYWDYVHEHVFGRAGMTGSAYYTRTQWLTDEHIAHSYMRQADGSRVDAVRNLDKGSVNPPIAGRNPARAFIGNASGDGFATAPDLVRFAHALRDGTLLDRPFAELLTGAKLPGSTRTSFRAYTGPLHLVNGRQWEFGRGGSTAGSAANWSVYPDTGWVGVVLSNYDDIPLPEILQQQEQAITGQAVEPPVGG